MAFKSKMGRKRVSKRSQNVSLIKFTRVCAKRCLGVLQKGLGEQKGVVLREKVRKRGAPKVSKRCQKCAKRSRFEKTVVTFLHMVVDR